MPSRVVRAEINESESLSRVSLFADLTFRALIVGVDDYGRFDARPAMLKATLFPMRNDVSAGDVAGWVDELTQGENPPVRIYESGGRPYLVLTGWEKNRGKSRRAATSKFPAPPEGHDKNEQSASPDIREIREDPADPPGSRESGSESRESRVVSSVPSEQAAPTPPAPGLFPVEPEPPPPKPDPASTAFSDSDSLAWLAPMLGLRAGASPEERARWVATKRLELVHGAQAEAQSQNCEARPRGIQIASARWNAYLRTARPREFEREAVQDGLRAAIAAAREPPDDESPEPAIPSRLATPNLGAAKP